MSTDARETPRRSWLPRDVVAGLFLLGLAAIGYLGAYSAGVKAAASAPA